MKDCQKLHLIIILAAVGSVIGMVGSAEAYDCALYLDIDTYYVDDCALQVDVTVEPFSYCGPPLPGRLELHLYVNAPSYEGGTLGGWRQTGCQWLESLWPSTFALDEDWDRVYIEPWVHPVGSEPAYRCTGWDPIEVVVIPGGDSDGDGVPDCDDQCPETPADTQVGANGCPLGDVNCDGFVDFFDLDPFVLAITDPAGYEAAYPDCDIMLADCNEDGVVDFFDIDSFIGLVTGG